MGLFFVYGCGTPQQAELWGERARKVSQEASYLPDRGWKQYTHQRRTYTHAHVRAHSVTVSWLTHLCWTLWAMRKKKNQALWLWSYWKSEGHTHTQKIILNLRTLQRMAAKQLFIFYFEEVKLLLLLSLTPHHTVRWQFNLQLAHFPFAVRWNSMERVKLT